MSNTTSPFNLMKLRLWRRRMSVSSPRMTIRSQLPWPMRLLFIAAIALAGAGAMWRYDAGGYGVAGSDGESARERLSHYRDQVEQLTAERDRLSSATNASESQLNIERAAQRQLATQVKSLESENTRLKEDLAFFDSLLPNATGPQGISIRRLKIDPVPPNQIRYRLLVMQGGKGEQTFVGSLQLVASVLQDGKSAMMTFPDASPAEQGKFRLGFKYYQRVEGVLTLPEGVIVQTVQARVLEKGQIRAQQSANL